MSKAFVTKLSALAISTILCVLAAEFAVRWIAPQTLSIWSHTRDGLVIHRSGIRAYRTLDGKRIDTNSVGMRDDDHSFEKHPGVYRILLFGDSYMEAMQVNWEDTLAARLAKQLNDGGERNVEIINASVSGWGTDDQLTYYLRYARAYSPDLILLGMTLHNDVSDNLLMEFHSFDNGRLTERPRKNLPALVYARQRVQEWLASNSHLYWLVVGALRAESVQADGRQLNRHVAALVGRNPPDRLRAGWEMTIQLLDKLRKKAAAAGTDMAVFLIPLAIQVTDARLVEFTRTLELDPSELDLRRPQRIMLGWGASRKVVVMDLLPGFRDWAAVNHVDPYRVEDGHWNEQGHALAAEIVAHELIENRLVPTGRMATEDSSR